MKKVFLQKIRSESKDGTLYITVCDNLTTAKQVEYHKSYMEHFKHTPYTLTIIDVSYEFEVPDYYMSAVSYNVNEYNDENDWTIHYLKYQKYFNNVAIHKHDVRRKSC